MNAIPNRRAGPPRQDVESLSLQEKSRYALLCRESQEKIA